MFLVYFCHNLHHECMSSGVAWPLVLAGHLLAISLALIAWHEWDEHGALAAHVLGQARARPGPAFITPLWMSPKKIDTLASSSHQKLQAKG